MGIFRALGIGLFLIILASLMPAAFEELAKTIVIFFRSAQEALMAAGTLASHANNVPQFLPPQAP